EEAEALARAHHEVDSAHGVDLPVALDEPVRLDSGSRAAGVHVVARAGRRRRGTREGSVRAAIRLPTSRTSRAPKATQPSCVSTPYAMALLIPCSPIVENSVPVFS